MKPTFTLLTVLLMAPLVSLRAADVPKTTAEFDVVKFGATPDDESDDTLAIRAALAECAKAGGGAVLIPKGVFIVSRQKNETPVLAIPSRTTFRGLGEGSIVKFAEKANESNFWRMLGSTDDCADIRISNLHLDGGNTHPAYVKGKTPEQNHGIFFYRKEGRIERVTVEDCLIENFGGDCVSFSQGCRNFTIRNVTVRNFIRQGIQMGGGKGDGGHLVIKCKDLKHTIKPGGTTIHVEHAEGAVGFRIIDNICRQSLLAGGGAKDLIVRDNEIHGRIEGNGIRNGLFENNRLIAGDGEQALMQFGYADGLVLRGNTIQGENSTAVGIYVWGTSRYNPEPSKNITIENNVLKLAGQPVFLNGVHGGMVRGNTVHSSHAGALVKTSRVQDVMVESGGGETKNNKNS